MNTFIILPDDIFFEINQYIDFYDLLNLELTCKELFEKFKNSLWKILTINLLNSRQIQYKDSANVFANDLVKNHFIDALRSKVNMTTISEKKLNDFFLGTQSDWIKNYSNDLKHFIYDINGHLRSLSLYVYMNISFPGTYKYHLYICIEESFSLEYITLIVRDRIRQVNLSEELICVNSLQKNKWIYIQSSSFQIFKKNYKVKLEIKNLERGYINSGLKISHSLLLPEYMMIKSK
jgi:hypothetical protein